MVPSITSKLPNVGTTIFTVMSGLAAKLNAVNLGQGYPDYSMSPELVALVNEAMNINRKNTIFIHLQYKPGYTDHYYSRWYLCYLYSSYNSITTRRRGNCFSTLL